MARETERAEQGKGGAMKAEVVEGVLCFAWQDNNTVLGITTAYSPDDLVVRTRKKPAETSTNAAIVSPVFGDEYTKDLAIPRLIDEYNHHMGGWISQTNCGQATAPTTEGRSSIGNLFSCGC